MLAGLVQGKTPFFQQLHHVRSGDVEQVCCFLRRQLGMYWHDFDRVAVRQLGEDVDEQTQCRGRKLHLVRLGFVVKDLDMLGLEPGVLAACRADLRADLENAASTRDGSGVHTYDSLHEYHGSRYL